ncbi:MAG TPA: glycosyltransferase, partial [Burkholderiales bacterium]|nr:glycosyltransferase [Burkholderiales bacterium]
AFRGKIAQARAMFRQLLTLADERGDARFASNIYTQLCELELRAGNVQAAASLIVEWDEHAIQDDLTPSRARCRALLAAIAGDPGEAVRAADFATQAAQPNTVRWDMLEAARARGIAALFQGDPERAVAALRPVWEHTRLAGVDEPGAFPVLPDLVEALADLEQIGEAAEVTGQLEDLARRQGHPWGLVTARRCRAVIALAAGHAAEAATELADAARAYGELGLRFDEARSLLLLGRAARRARQRGAARAALGAHARDTVFAFAGPGFAEKGLGAAIDALAAAGTRHLWLVVAGEDPDSGRFAARARQAGIADRVRFLGATEDLRAVYAAADCLLLPARSEAFPDGVLEALAMGLPAIVGRGCGAAEILRDGQDGWLCDPVDTLGLARLLDEADRAMRDPRTREAARACAQRYGIGETAKKLAGIYLGLLGR